MRRALVPLLLVAAGLDICRELALGPVEDANLQG